MLELVVRARTRGAKKCARALAVVSIALAACTKSGGGGHTQADRYWVSIDATSATVATGTATLRGYASCDACPPAEVAFGGCPPIQGPFASGIDVLWNNLTTGESGGALHLISGHCACLFSYCTVSYAHVWTADVPLAIGPNEIELVAAGFAMDPGSETIVITRLPPAPIGVDATSALGKVTVHWDPVAVATSYDLYWSSSPDLEPASTQKISGATSPFEHTQLANDTTYFYAVTAVVDAYESPRSEVVWATPGWLTQQLPMSAAAWQVADTSIAIDALDHAHVHVSRTEQQGTSVIEHNEYATDASGTWESMPVATPAWGDADVAVDSRLDAHVSYVGMQGMTHAVRQFGAWVTESVDSEATCYSALALDPLDKVHLAYRAVHLAPPQVGELRYATNASGAWHAQVVDAAEFGCSPGAPVLSLAVQSDGTAHLAYLGVYPGYGLQYALDEGGVWSHATLDPNYLRSLTLALDASGRPHVVYSDVQANLRHASRDALGIWTIEDIAGEGAADWPSLAIDDNGGVHVSFVSGSGGGELRYATNASGVWRIVRIDPNAYGNTALALDSNGRAHISYFSGGACMYATQQ